MRQANDSWQRKFRVGVLNSGASVANVAVKVARIHPELRGVMPMLELQQTHEAEGTSRFTVNKSAEPLVFVEVVRQDIHVKDGTSSGSIGGVEWRKAYKKGETYRLQFVFADHDRDFKAPGEHPTEPYAEQYLIWLAIDAAGAEKAQKFVLRKGQNGQYEFSEAFA